MTLFDKQEVLQEAGEAVEYASAELASSAAGLPGLRKPTTLPDGLVFETAAVTGQSFTQPGPRDDSGFSTYSTHLPSPTCACRRAWTGRASRCACRRR